ncbi:antibiotic biosynthesis monooxygenase [Actinophytocola xinjiangensis]|uniref:Antibiotic biosynthesis monooxygenase n=1 Tax=Actinophytocola xinjiangensis TaxID=485602 RepID=A0A7Z0WFM9_9PSEU|nr:antibiotic biosynthesis monooxygenase family protein [Actinophytocola xinjiangensis]OLF06120.1 antibiotic biosynthesis monooxygenase [Actinophytocola xinjiangensis]
MIIVAGHLAVDPAGRDAYVAGCRPVVEAARAAPGCLDFTITADAVDPGRVNVYERWESGETVEAFRGAGPPATQQAEILDADVARYVISSVEAP